MLIFYKERLAFLSVPKTGTTAYESALAPRADMVISEPPMLKHAPVYRYNRFIRPMFLKVCDVELELMAVRREPVSWLGSWYRYRQRPFMEGKDNSTHGISFDDFVLAYMKGQMDAHRDIAVPGVLEMMGQDDIFTKAAVESSLDKMEEAVGNPLPDEAKGLLGMLGFQIVVNFHGDVVEIKMPEQGMGDGEY